MIYLFADEFRFAEHYARYTLNIPKSQWVFIDDENRMRGMAQVEVTMLVTPRHNQTTSQRVKRAMLLEICQARRIPVTRVYLP